MNTKEKIVYSLVNLMNKKPYENITIKEIAENAEINRSSYYYNFNSKDEIIKYQLKKIINEYFDFFEMIENKTKENYIYVMLAISSSYEKFFSALYKSNQIYIFQQLLIDSLRKAIKMSSEENLYEIYYFAGGLCNFIICWISKGMPGNIRKLSKIAARFIGNYNPTLIIAS